MDAAAVKAALTKRWPDDRYLHIYEAPLDSARQGTKIDVAVVALWHSKGLAIDAVEVKVSYQDWLNEIEDRRLWAVFPDGRRIWCRNMIDARRWERSTEGVTIERTRTTDTSKSLLWREHAHRFWIAAPAKVADRIALELPQGWGLLSVTEDGSTVLAKPVENRNVRLLDWPKVIGLLRAAADSGSVALARAEARGRQQVAP